MTRRPFYQWEPEVPGTTQNGQEHIFDKITESDIPYSQENKYLCGLVFSEEPSTDLFIYLNMLEPSFRKENLERNKCPICLRKLKDKYPELDHLQ